jgi:hypothetical protein
MDRWFDIGSDDPAIPPGRWMWENFEIYRDWMTEMQTYEQYVREHAARPENPARCRQVLRVDWEAI